MSPGTDRRRGDRFLAVIAIACIAMQFPGDFGLSALALAAWLAALAGLDRPALRRMWMPRFWAITVVLALGTGFLLGRSDLDLGGLPMSSAGLQAGALMVVRGGLIFGLASWAGRALTGSRLRRSLAAVGLGSLGEAASVALGLLPGLQGRLRAIRQAQAPGARGIRGRVSRLDELAVSAFCETVRVAEALAAGRAGGGRARVAAVVGSPGQGKTSRILRTAEGLRRAGLRVGGVAQPAVGPGGARTGYELLDLATGERRAFASLAPDSRPGGPRFSFDDAGWAWAADRIRTGRRTADVVVVDEIGRLEAAGGGHLAALREAEPGERARWWLLAVRADGVDAVARQVGGFDVRWNLALPADGSLSDADDGVARMLEMDAMDGKEGAR